MTFSVGPSGYLRCSDVLDFLGTYVAGELGEEERREFDRHLAVCAACLAYLESYRDTIALARAAAAEELAAAEPPAELVRAILAARRG